MNTAGDKNEQTSHWQAKKIYFDRTSGCDRNYRHPGGNAAAGTFGGARPCQSRQLSGEFVKYRFGERFLRQ